MAAHGEALTSAGVTLMAITDFVGDVIDAVGALGLALLLLGETLFPPLPSEAILPLAGFYVEQGRLSYVVAVIGATIGSLTGALIFYALGRYGGRPLVLRDRRFLRVRERDLDRAERWFTSYGPWMVLVARVIPLVRSYISIPAGTMRMNLAAFCVLTFIGSAVWNAALIGAGWALGDRWEEVSDAVGAASPFVVVGVALLCVFAVGWWRWRRAGARAGS